MAITNDEVEQLKKQAETLQSSLANAREDLQRTEITGTAAGGAVSVTMTATGEFLAVRIDPEIIEESEPEELEGIVLAALRDGAAQLQESSTVRLGMLTAALKSFD